MSSFESKTFVVIGGNGAIGRALATALREHAAKVVIADLPTNRQDQVGSQGIDLPIDLLDPEATDAALGDYFRHHGTPDGLVITAGLYPAAYFRDMSAARIQQLFLVNTISPGVILSRYHRALEASDRQGVAVVTSSQAAARFRVGTSAYSASKAALNALVQTLALETSPRLRINVVSPGYVSAGSELNPIPAEYEEMLKERSPEQRLARPDDLVSCYLWLLDEASHWVRGAIIAVDGGASLGNPADKAWLAPSGIRAQ